MEIAFVHSSFSRCIEGEKVIQLHLQHPTKCKVPRVIRLWISPEKHSVRK